MLNVTASAASVLAANTVKSSAKTTAITGSTTGQRTSPVPIAGSRSEISPRRGRDEPRTTITTMITSNGSTSDIPVTFRWS